MFSVEADEGDNHPNHPIDMDNIFNEMPDCQELRQTNPDGNFSEKCFLLLTITIWTITYIWYCFITFKKDQDVCISDNETEVIRIDSDKEYDDDEERWPVQVLDEYAHLCIAKDKPLLIVKQEKVESAVQQNIKGDKLQFEMPLQIKRPSIKPEELVVKKMKKESLPVEITQNENNVEVQKNSCLNFPKKQKMEKLAEDISINEAISAITEKFNNHRKNETLKSKARIICTHLLSVKEKYRSKCLIKISGKISEYMNK